MRLEEEIKQKEFKNPYQKLIVNILFTSGWLSSRHSKVLKPYGISAQQYNVLRILRGQHSRPVSINLLVERMLDKMSNASRLVEKLRQKQLVERHECPNDRRQVDVFITPKGLELLDELDGKLEFLETNFQTLTEEEVNLLNELLDKLRS
ncbi:MAG: MarR family transcriptional regulator [Bacteroidia bacterium]